MAHPVPDSVLEQDIAILGQKGAGKSIAAKGLVERLLREGRRTIVIDPLNHWYGLRGKPDGSPGFPIVVIGGPNADIPLDPNGGELLGRVLAASNHSFVVDVSDLVKSRLIIFATAFLNSLYQHNRRALWLVAEEGDILAPQNPAMDGTRAMLDAMDLIARRGRQRGFRLWTVTQRPARIAKDVLSMASALLLMRIRGPQDRSAAEDWVKGHATKEETANLVGGLAGLEVGQGYVYAPDLDLLERVRFPMIETLDTSSTPKAGDAPRQIGTMANVDVEALRKALEPPPAAPLQRAAYSADDHAEAVGLDLEAIRREARHAGHVEGYQKGHAAGVALERSAVLGLLKPMIETLEDREIAAPAPPVPDWTPSKLPPDGAIVRAPKPSGEMADYRINSPIKPTTRKILDEIQRAYPAALTFRAAAKRAGVSMRSSQLRDYEREVLGSHEIHVVDGRITSKTAPPLTRAPGQSPVEVYASRLAPSWGNMLRAVAASQFPISRTSIAEIAGVSLTSSGLAAGLKELEALDLIVRHPDGQYSLSPDLQ